METYPIYGENGARTSAFEIENIYIGIRAIRELLERIQEVSNVRPASSIAKRDDVRIEFDFRERPFVVLEPFGDSSRYWIGPKDSAVDAMGDISSLEAAFRRHRPPIAVRLLGDIVTFRWLKRWK